MKRDAFSLVELLIVVLIIGVVYSLSISSLKKIQDNKTEVTLKNLKEQLLTYPFKNSVELLCLEDCSSCYLFLDGEKYSEDDLFDNFMDDSVTIYKYNFNSGLTEAKKKVYFNNQDVEEDVCFSYSMDKNGVGDQIMVEFKGKVYDFSTYFVSTPVYNSVKEAVDAKEKQIQEMLQ